MPPRTKANKITKTSDAATKTSNTAVKPSKAAKASKALCKPSKAAGKPSKPRPILDDVVNQLVSLQGYGITQDSSLLQMCGGSEVHDEHAALMQKFSAIIGVDEAGRGCLAGPVVAAAVILPTGPLAPTPNATPNTTSAGSAAATNTHDALKSHLGITPHLASLGLAGLADSKKLTEAQRDALAPLIRQHAVAWGLGVVWPSTIDDVNILQATFLAMARAVNSLHSQGSLMLIDGNKTIPAHAFQASQAFQHNGIDKSATQQHAVVGGDDIVPVISAASILAKTYRDKLMVAFDKRYPNYGFAKHKGYGTKDHLAALAEHGPCAQHRLTFRGVVLQDETEKKDSPKAHNSTATSLRLC